MIMMIRILLKVKDKLLKLEGEIYSINKLNKIAKEVDKLTYRNDYGIFKRCI